MDEKMNEQVRLTRYALNTVVEGLCFLLWLSRGSIREIIFNRYVSGSFHPKSMKKKIRTLCRQGYIHRLNEYGWWQLTFACSDWNQWGNEWQLKRQLYKQGWDKQWRVVVYDIPEKQRHLRNSFRVFIKNLGFGKVNDSVWVSPYDYNNRPTIPGL